MSQRLPALVATDLDGTLVRSDGTVSPYTREVLLELDRRGVPVVFVTGRPLRWAEAVFDYVAPHGLAVVSNGAMIWDVARADAHLVRPIQPELGLAMCHVLREAVPGTHFAVETLDGLGIEHGYVQDYEPPPGTRRGELAEIVDRPVLKLLARHLELTPQDFWDAAEVAVAQRLVVTWSSASALLEISAPGVTKASTLALLCADLGVDAADVIAFGDMPNDLAMLSWAGRSYAMADAHPTVTAAADHVAPGHDEDGVARVLADVFGLER